MCFWIVVSAFGFLFKMSLSGGTLRSWKNNSYKYTVLLQYRRVGKRCWCSLTRTSCEKRTWRRSKAPTRKLLRGKLFSVCTYSALLWRKIGQQKSSCWETAVCVRLANIKPGQYRLRAWCNFILKMTKSGLGVIALESRGSAKTSYSCQ